MKRHNYTILVDMPIVFMGVEWWKTQSLLTLELNGMVKWDHFRHVQINRPFPTCHGCW
jgi:hypothetical protein